MFAACSYETRNQVFLFSAASVDVTVVVSTTEFGVRLVAQGFFYYYFPVPSAAPGQVLVTAKSSTSLHVSWLAIPQEHRHGKIRMHNIYISLATQPSNYITTYFAFNSVEYNISDLRVYTLYVIRVSAVNDAGEGPKSRAVTTRTSEGSEFISYQ